MRYFRNIAKPYYVSSASAYSNTFSPRQFASLLAWVRADLGVTTGAGLVTIWADQSGNGFNATTGTGPTFTNSGLNSKASIVFDAASSQYLTFGTALGRTANYTFGCVFSATDATVGQSQYGSVQSNQSAPARWVGHLLSNNVSQRVTWSFGNDTTSSAGNNTNGTIASATTTQTIQTHTDGDGSPAGTGVKFYVNGTFQGSTSLGGTQTHCTGVAKECTLGRDGAAATAFMTGQMGEFFVYSVPLSASQIKMLSQYTRVMWGHG